MTNHITQHNHSECEPLKVDCVNVGPVYLWENKLILWVECEHNQSKSIDYVEHNTNDYGPIESHVIKIA